MSKPHPDEASQEPDELSFASFRAQSPNGGLINHVSELLQGIVTNKNFDQAALEPVVVEVFAGLRTDVPSQLAWYFSANYQDYRPLHALNSCRLAMHFGITSGMDDARVVQLGIVALLADISMWLPDLPGMNGAHALNAEEMAKVESAVEPAAQLLEAVEGLDPLCARVAREHHERADGTGYPNGSSADDHHPYSRLMQIIDSYLGMIEPRAFRRPINPVEAMQRLAVQAHRGYFHEPSFRDWLKVMGVFPVGAFVTLNTGELAIVTHSGGDSLRRPKIQVLADEYQEFRLKPMRLDLAGESAFDVTEAFTKFPKG